MRYCGKISYGTEITNANPMMEKKRKKKKKKRKPDAFMQRESGVKYQTILNARL